VFAPAGGVEQGWQSAFRSKTIEGPYEERIVMRQGGSSINGPHQGAWVRNGDGSDWFLHFQDKRAYGRVVHLQPMAWKDGWPLIGADRGVAAGEPVLTHAKPAGLEGGIRVPATSDEFGASRLGVQWQWSANPQAGWYALDARPGQLRLFAQPENASLRNVGSVLTQKLPAPAFTVDTKIVHHGRGRAGLILLGLSTAWLGVRDGQLVYSTCQSPAQGEQQASNQQCDESAPQVLAKTGKRPVYLRMAMGEGGIARFSYSVDGRRFIPAGKPFAAQMGRWVGAQMGVFALGESGSWADVDYFRVAPPAQ
jgi:beta-xylosidase